MSLLRQIECGLLLIETVLEPTSDGFADETYSRSMAAIKQAAALAEVPVHRALYGVTVEAAAEEDGAAPVAAPHALSPSLLNWRESPLGLAIADTERPCIIVAGYWLEEAVTFGVLSALGEGYDTYAMFDVTRTLNASAASLAQQRLIHAGAVPTVCGQVVREWAAHITEPRQRQAILDTIIPS
ncbi:MAG: hypothetical protein KJ587_02330 [Alphaproteobacteria bacterium]|nr:hypothetical protein [Alphaproteobacteria bacterium]